MKRCLPVLLLMACHSNHQSNPNAAAPRRGVVQLDTEGKTIKVEVDVASTKKQRTRGLMYRKHLRAREGMWFIFEREEGRTFWMKNTYIPLDMIFIDSEMKVAGVVKNAEPLTTHSRGVERPSRYVLEVRGGFAEQHGISTKTRAIFTER